MEVSMIVRMALDLTMAVKPRLNLAKAAREHDGVSLMQKARYGRLEALFKRHSKNIILFRGMTRVPPLQLTQEYRVTPRVPVSPSATHWGSQYLVQ